MPIEIGKGSFLRPPPSVGLSTGQLRARIIAPQRYKVSIAYPKLFSKGYDSLIIVQICLPAMYSETKKVIMRESKAQKVTECVWDIYLYPGLKIRMKLFSHVLSFSDPVVRQIGNSPVIARFTAIPKENCQPGLHQAILSIADAETQIEYESISFVVQIADFAFDHISRPLLSKMVSAVLGIGSLAMFILTALEQVDKTFGLTAGTAAAMLTSTILFQWWSIFRRPGITHTS
ncbi:MAG: hypothetical protein QXZ11_09255 [Thermoproteota archaeon]